MPDLDRPQPGQPGYDFCVAMDKAFHDGLRRFDPRMSEVRGWVERKLGDTMAQLPVDQELLAAIPELSTNRRLYASGRRSELPL